MENNIPAPSEEAVIEVLTLTCEINEFGTKRYYNKDGNFHRSCGPAVIFEDGTKFWYKNGDLHREDGPASIWYDGSKEYYINNVELSKYQFIQWQKKNGIKPIE